MIGLKFACAVGLVVAVAGCTPAPAPSSVAPTFACTPEAGGSPYACSSADFEEMKRKDALYAEAEQVFRRLVAEDERTDKAGGSRELSPLYLELLGTEALRQQQLEILRANLSENVIARGGTYEIKWLRRAPGLVQNDSDVTIKGCVDTSSVQYFRSGHSAGHGSPLVQTAFLKFIDGGLRAVEFSNLQVASCSAG